ncbi:MAG: sugar transporter substrate-binding protein, partial [Mycobacterium sp.]|nr:sugar transporter substrate-binding protein [Mycobacterium sp.]
MKIRNILPSPVLPALVCAASVVAMTACSSSVNNNAEPSDTASSATNVEVDDGGCAENRDQIAQLQQDLSKNLYGIAAAESGKGERTNPNPIPEGDPIKITFSVEGLSHPFLVKQKQLAE